MKIEFNASELPYLNYKDQLIAVCKKYGNKKGVMPATILTEIHSYPAPDNLAQAEVIGLKVLISATMMMLVDPINFTGTIGSCIRDLGAN